MILSYETVKYVSIQDSRLGVLRYLFMILIVFYVGYIELYAHGGYLLSDTVHGVLRLTLQQPTVNDCDPFSNNDTNNTTNACENNFRPLHELPFCRQKQQHHQQQVSTVTTSTGIENTSDVYYGNIYPCEYYEAINAQIISETSVTVMTRAKTLNQTFICGDTQSTDNNIHETCPHTYETTTDTTPPSNTTTMNPTTTTTAITPFYIAQSEAFTILMDHAVTSSKLCGMLSSSITTTTVPDSYTCSSLSSQYGTGRLYSTNTELCQQYTSYPTMTTGRRNRNVQNHNNYTTASAPCYIEPNVTENHNVEYFSVDVLLRAAGIHSLDDCSSNTMNHNQNSTTPTSTTVTNCTTYRESGATVIVHVIWNDFIPYHGRVPPYYYYRVQLINKSYKTYIPYYHSDYRRGGRTLIIAHGIRFVFVLSGEFHAFHTTTLIITITTAVGLLAVATTVVDYLMIYILPEKDQYTKAKYEATNEVTPVELPNAIIPSFIQQHSSRTTTAAVAAAAAATSSTTRTLTRGQQQSTIPTNVPLLSSSSSNNAEDEESSTIHDPLLPEH